MRVSNYERLIFLAKETDTPSTPQRISELNKLLSGQDVKNIEDYDLQILDDLISILSNTDNLLAEEQESIIKLQERIRSKMYD